MENLPDSVRRIASWRMDLLRPLKPRARGCFPCIPDVVVYTDEASLSNRIAGLIMTRSVAGPIVNLLCDDSVPKSRLSKFHRRNPIIWMGIIAPLSLIRTAQNRFRNKCLDLYIDNDTSANALIRGARRSSPFGHDRGF